MGVAIVAIPSCIVSHCQQAHFLHTRRCHVVEGRGREENRLAVSRLRKFQGRAREGSARHAPANLHPNSLLYADTATSSPILSRCRKRQESPRLASEPRGDAPFTSASQAARDCHFGGVCHRASCGTVGERRRGMVEMRATARAPCISAQASVFHGKAPLINVNRANPRLSASHTVTTTSDLYCGHATSVPRESFCIDESRRPLREPRCASEDDHADLKAEGGSSFMRVFRVPGASARRSLPEQPHYATPLKTRVDGEAGTCCRGPREGRGEDRPELQQEIL